MNPGDYDGKATNEKAHECADIEPFYHPESNTQSRKTGSRPKLPYMRSYQRSHCQKHGAC